MQREANENAQLFKIILRLIKTVNNTILMYVNPKKDCWSGGHIANIGKWKVANWVIISFIISKLLSSRFIYTFTFSINIDDRRFRKQIIMY